MRPQPDSLLSGAQDTGAVTLGVAAPHVPSEAKDDE